MADANEIPAEAPVEAVPESEQPADAEAAAEPEGDSALGKRKPEEDCEASEEPAAKRADVEAEPAADAGGDAPAPDAGGDAFAPDAGGDALAPDATAAGENGEGMAAAPFAEVHTEEVDCPPTMVGRLIGKGGETIKSLEMNHGAKIQIDQDTKKVSITGHPTQVANCVRAVNELLAAPGEGPGMDAATAEAQEIVDCPPGLVGRIIGRGGETIKGLQAVSGATISIDQNFPENQPRKVHVSGSAAAVATGKKMVMDLLEGGPSTAASIIGATSQGGFAMDCPKEMVGRVIGRGGETIKGLQHHSGARIQIDQSGNPCKVSITGNPHAVAEAQRMITDIVNGGSAAQYSVNAPTPPMGGGGGGRPYPDPYAGGYGPPGGGYPPYGGYPGPAPGGYGGYPPPAGYGGYGGYGHPGAYGAPGGHPPPYGYDAYGGGYGHGYDPAAYGGYGASGSAAAATSAAPAAGGDAASPWQALQDDQQRTYYYNSQTGVSQWEKPEGMP